MNSVTCFDDFGRLVDVPEASIQFRPAVYGILIENDQVLLQPHTKTDLWQLPGDILSLNEEPETAVRRYFQASTGIAPELGPLVFIEDRYWIDPEENGWRLTVLYYALRRPSTGVAGLIDFESPFRPEWVPLNETTAENMQSGFEAVQAAQTRLDF